jgi:hypothetical protein
MTCTDEAPAIIGVRFFILNRMNHYLGEKARN